VRKFLSLYPFGLHWPVSALFGLCLLALSACSGAAVGAGVGTTPGPATRQVLIFPNVGIQDLDTLDPTQASDENADQAFTMIYSGLLRRNQDLAVVPDQATWTISPDRRVYTFALKPGLVFSDGTPITAASYVYSLSRALSPALQAGNALLLLGAIMGANRVNAGLATMLSGVRALDAATLQITLSKPTEYFLQALACPLAFVVNRRVIERYGTGDWSDFVAGHGVGSGPFVVKEWQHNARIVLVPNTRYYGPHSHLDEVDMIFVVDAHTAFQAFQGGQYSLVWNIMPTDLAVARGLAGFATQSLLETDALFFNTTIPPFDQPAVRQAFAYATDKTLLVQTVLSNSAIPAPTMLPIGIPGYQPALTPMDFSRAQALDTLHTVYPDATQMPAVTFAYPSSLVSSAMALTLQHMWQTALGVQIKLVPVETNAYAIEMQNHQVQFGFEQWEADFPDPYDFLALDLLSSVPGNIGQWSNSHFDDAITQAEQTSGPARLALYAQAEQVAVSDVGLLPLDHQTLSVVIPPAVHGVSLSHLGLYFGDWSTVSLSSH
jgi:ABC-type oligopeptide transport system substrate-binding subunit